MHGSESSTLLPSPIATQCLTFMGIYIYRGDDLLPTTVGGLLRWHSLGESIILAPLQTIIMACLFCPLKLSTVHTVKVFGHRYHKLSHQWVLPPS